MDEKNKYSILSISDFQKEEITGLLMLATLLKNELKTFGQNEAILAGRTLAMLFEKPSLRTRLSFEVGMTQLGGHAVYLSPSDIGIGVRESVPDIARVAGSMADALMARVYQHETLTELAKYSSKPVINGLSDMEHPCQTLADLLTMKEIKGDISGLTVAFVGDGENNVVHSLALASKTMGFHLCVAAPVGYWMNPKIANVTDVAQVIDPKEAVSGAHVVYTDTWVSMGDEAQKEKRFHDFASYQVTGRLMKLARKDAIFMHDLPAYRGHEVTSDVIEGQQSVVFQQAENRLHAQKALLAWVFGIIKGTSL